MFATAASSQCHSKRSEESLIYFWANTEQLDPEMFRFAQHDSIIYEMNSG